MKELLRKLWKDEDGAVITAEYLTLGSVVAFGTAAGMSSMRDTMIDECKEFGSAVREVSQASREPALEMIRNKQKNNRVRESADSNTQDPQNLASRYQFVTP